MTNAIEADGLTKRFGATTALDGLDLSAPTGTVLGLLGPNGAGKTTAVRVLTTLLRPDAGRARVAGYDTVRDAHQVRASIALTGQFAAVDGDLSGRANLVLVGRLLGATRRGARARADELLGSFGLADAAGEPAKDYSGGMRRRLDLAVSLVGRPEVLFLDEPTTGLDPRSRADVWATVRDLVADGTSVLLTTQYLEEVDRLADSIAVIDNGKVIARGSSPELKARLGGQTLHVRPLDPARLDEAASVLAELAHGPLGPGPSAGSVSAPVAGTSALPELVRRLEAAGIAVDELALARPTLDDVFLTLTGHGTTGSASREGAEGTGRDDRQDRNAA